MTDIERKYNGEFFIGKSFNECLALIDKNDICEYFFSKEHDSYIFIGSYYNLALILDFSKDFVCESYEWD